MSNCGACGGSGFCTCTLEGDSLTAVVAGNGSTYAALNARPLTPAYRPAGLAYRTTIQALASGTTAINFENSEMPFAEDMWDPLLPSRLTFPLTGLYMIGGYISAAATGSPQSLTVMISKNGAVITVSNNLVARTVTYNAAGGSNLQADVMTLDRFTAGEYIELFAISSGAVNTSSTQGGATPGTNIGAHPFMWANYLSD